MKMCWICQSTPILKTNAQILDASGAMGQCLLKLIAI